MTDTAAGQDEADQADAAAAEAVSPPVAGGDDDQAAAPQTSAWRLRAPWITAGVLFVLAVALAVLAASVQGRLTADRDDREEIQRVSGNLASSLLTYDFRDLDGWKARVLRDATGTFRRTFEETFERSLQPIVTEVQASSTATVKSIFMSEIDDTSATTIVVVDSVATSPAGRNPGFDTYVQIDLVEVDGRWKVNNVTDLQFGRSGGAPVGNAGPSTTVQGANT